MNLDRVREYLRDHHAPAPLSERDAVQRLRPYGQGVQAELQPNPPLNRRAPHQLAEPGARRDLFDAFSESTG